MPPRPAGKSSGVSSRGGRRSSASRARVESGTSRRDPARLAEVHDLAVAHSAANVQRARLPVNVAAFERLPLLGT